MTARCCAMERAHLAYLQEGRELPAARAAFWCGYRLMPLGEIARAQAWFARGSASSIARDRNASSTAI